MKITSTDKEEKKSTDLLDPPVPYALKLANHKPPNYFCNKQYNTYNLRSTPIHLQLTSSVTRFTNIYIFDK